MTELVYDNYNWKFYNSCDTNSRRDCMSVGQIIYEKFDLGVLMIAVGGVR